MINAITTAWKQNVQPVLVARSRILAIKVTIHSAILLTRFQRWSAKRLAAAATWLSQESDRQAIYLEDWLLEREAFTESQVPSVAATDAPRPAGGSNA